MADPRSFFGEQLAQPTTALAFGISERLARMRPDAFILEASCGVFDLLEYAGGGHCRVALEPTEHSQIVTTWEMPGAMYDRPAAAWYTVSWQQTELEVVIASWQEAWSSVRWHWIIAPTEALARRFYDEASAFCSELREEILVFSDGSWGKSPRLYRAIRKTQLDSLVLRGDLVADITRDCQQFFAARGLYAEYKIPWKRGVLLLGPPGNGKTHCVKGLINALARPCLYVQSFRAQYSTDQSNIEEVFSRARKSAPCVLVLEDLDSLLSADNRSFFLNELDGFSENQGILTIATTNYPERLDPSILERPSRFDVKYYFELPAAAERRDYLDRWNANLADALQLADDVLAELSERTTGFSFAYLKELCVSSLMRWFHDRDTPLATVMLRQVGKLQEQLSPHSSDEPT